MALTFFAVLPALSFAQNPANYTADPLFLHQAPTAPVVGPQYSIPVSQNQDPSSQTTTTAPTCPATVSNIPDFLCRVAYLLKLLIPILLALGALLFIWGVIAYVIAQDEDAKTKGRDKIIYGLIGLVVITAMWGLVQITLKTFGKNETASTNITNVTSALQTTSSTGCDQNWPTNKKVTIKHLLDYSSCVISRSIIPFIFALATLMFLYGVVEFLSGAQEEAKREKGKSFMIWGIVGLAVMVSVWGIVKIAGNTFKVDYVIPQLHTGVDNTATQ